MIDIVIPYYNDSDENWRNILYKYLKEENSNDRQVIGEERYRDWNNFKYFFRGIEENCKWVNKIFLIVSTESQIPDWLDTKNPKLRIVYHREYIPEELLPTFNPMTIELFVGRIEDLSDNYIYMNDDFFFLNPTNAEMFFINDYPVYRDNKGEFKKFDTSGEDGTFYQILNNGMDLQTKICGDKANWYSIYHLPVVHKKNFEKEIIDKHYEEFINANKSSKFRNKDNICSHVFICLYQDLKPYHIFNSYKNSSYVSVRKDTNFDDYIDKQMVCFNDTQLLKQEDFEETKNKMLDFFSKKFPNRSSYEREEVQ